MKVKNKVMTKVPPVRYEDRSGTDWAVTELTEAESETGENLEQIAIAVAFPREVLGWEIVPMTKDGGPYELHVMLGRESPQ